MTNASTRTGWLLDSGASSHMTPHTSDFRSHRALTSAIEVRIADGDSLKAVGVGDIAIRCGNNMKVTMAEVRHIPRLDRRLMSVSKLATNGLMVEFTDAAFKILKGSKCIMTAPR